MNKTDKKALKEYKEDIQQILENEEYERQEQQRIQFAQKNGNDSGFDPYWNM